MRSVWIDPGNKPEWPKLKSLGIGRAYFAANDPIVTTAFLKEQRAFGEVGIYRDPVWSTPRLSPVSLATQLNLDITRLGANNLQLAVSADLELAPMGDRVSGVAEFIDAWRLLRPLRMTEWTFEAEKAPLLTNDLALKCIVENIGVAPQLYQGDMSPVCGDWCVETLLQRGFQEIRPVYDAKVLPYHWGEPYGGTAFTQGRLPS